MRYSTKINNLQGDTPSEILRHKQAKIMIDTSDQGPNEFFPISTDVDETDEMVLKVNAVSNKKDQPILRKINTFSNNI